MTPFALPPHHPLGAAVNSFAEKTTNTDTRHMRVITAPMGSYSLTTNHDQQLHHSLPFTLSHTPWSVDDGTGKTLMLCIPSESGLEQMPNSRDKEIREISKVASNKQQGLYACSSPDQTCPLGPDCITQHEIKKVQFDPTLKQMTSGLATWQATGSLPCSASPHAQHTTRHLGNSHTKTTTFSYPLLGQPTTQMGWPAPPGGLPLPRSRRCTAPENAPQHAKRQWNTQSPPSDQPHTWSGMTTILDKAQSAQLLWDAHYNSTMPQQPTQSDNHEPLMARNFTSRVKDITPRATHMPTLLLCHSDRLSRHKPSQEMKCSQAKIKPNLDIVQTNQAPTTQSTTSWGDFFLPEDGSFTSTTTKQMCPSGLAATHPAGDLLQEWSTFGCPMMTGKPWSIQEMTAAIA